ncbi:AraC-like DNA-binding protein [Promicromonospora sp. AC04]|uniref:helix-turn-helix transcriptional regulator n=1 Tax=Promicromonospora sp. AC04 TaxID=2135723 RepID=UPI000D39F47C|nr:helix-turn-helix transcriptional regulator [Promicromonospora sp. AC04]PUB29785.1 AraC-like DNA-binding protein [Promicromonospora sp. AC04]
MTALKRERLPAGATWSGQGALWALVLAGAATLETAGARSQVLPGTAVLVDARTAHRLTADAETDVVHGDLRQAVPSTELPSPLVVHGFDEQQRGVVALVTTCPLDVTCNPEDLFAASYAGLIGAAMTSLWQAGDRPGGRAGDDANGTADAQVADVVAALAARPGEPWTLDRMAGLVHLSRSALTERFRRATGHSPMRMLREVRMHEARKLLTRECLPVTRVAFEVGYGSVAAFSRAFAADHGVSPLAWRAAPAPGPGPAPRQARPARPWVPSAAPGTSGARYPQERPAEPGGHRRGRADHQQQADTVPVQ